MHQDTGPLKTNLKKVISLIKKCFMFVPPSSKSKLFLFSQIHKTYYSLKGKCERLICRSSLFVYDNAVS